MGRRDSVRLVGVLDRRRGVRDGLAPDTRSNPRSRHGGDPVTDDRRKRRLVLCRRHRSDRLRRSAIAKKRFARDRGSGNCDRGHHGLAVPGALSQPSESRGALGAFCRRRRHAVCTPGGRPLRTIRIALARPQRAGRVNGTDCVGRHSLACIPAGFISGANLCHGGARRGWKRPRIWRDRVCERLAWLAARPRSALRFSRNSPLGNIVRRSSRRRRSAAAGNDLCGGDAAVHRQPAARTETSLRRPRRRVPR
ncbi:MAG: hypothetical protein JWM53_2979 [bacterium]|nr:hypothetical protein [bacterium]